MHTIILEAPEGGDELSNFQFHKKEEKQTKKLVKVSDLVERVEA